MGRAGRPLPLVAGARALLGCASHALLSSSQEVYQKAYQAHARRCTRCGRGYFPALLWCCGAFRSHTRTCIRRYTPALLWCCGAGTGVECEGPTAARGLESGQGGLQGAADGVHPKQVRSQGKESGMGESGMGESGMGELRLAAVVLLVPPPAFLDTLGAPESRAPRGAVDGVHQKQVRSQGEGSRQSLGCPALVPCD